MKLELLRHATLFIQIDSRKYLIDPMLSPAEAWDPVTNSTNPRRNPMVDLPTNRRDLENSLESLVAVFVTHIHADHWDDPAKEQLRKDLPLFCQPNDTDSISAAEFIRVMPVETSVEWGNLQIALTGGQHGTGEVAARIGPVSGFVIRSEGEPTLYIAGDTIWCPEVEAALETHSPNVIVVNAGAAQFADSDPITMDADDVIRVAEAAPTAQVVAVHMETINHCILTRTELSRAISEAGLSERVHIPADGETLKF